MNWTNEDLSENLFDSYYSVDNGKKAATKFRLECTTETSEIKLSNIKIYPNPNNGSFQVAGLSSSSYQIKDAVCKIVSFGTINSNNQTINVNLEAGIYMLFFTNNTPLKIAIF